MVRNYIPKKPFFEATRIHKIAKDVIRDCKDDRDRALETFTYFKGIVSSDPEDDKSKTEMVHALGLSQDANDKIVKVLDMMIKMTQNEQRIQLQNNKPAEEMSFEELRNMRAK
tara:strand:+ start:35232 stop:35570 length:339 start_codon:yes stop_codon:yes gene_type:complete